MKVYFGSDGSAVEVLWKSKVNHILVSFYHNPTWNERQVEWLRKYKSVMIDSGLFTFMFGAKAGTPMPWEFCVNWQANYVAYLKRFFRPTDIAVECDVQKKLGVEQAWELRKMFRKELKGRPTINVYHLEDDNPDRLIKFSDYIAVSQPELRLLVTDKERARITAYISKKALAAGKSVHLLGLTELSFMEQFKFCTSCDSTSWQSHFRWGGAVTQTWKVPATSIKGQKITQGVRSKTDRFWNGILFLEEYTAYAGSQE